jgi:hypothetical protein
MIKWNELYKQLKSELKNELNVEVVDIAYGDRYYNEYGDELVFTIAGNEYRVGYSNITEDRDDWGQAESYSNEWCRCNDEHISPEKVIEIISNYKILERDFKLNKLGIN